MQLAAGKLDDLVATPQRGEAVRHDEDGEIAPEPIDCVHDGAFRGVVQGAGGFVQDQHVGLLVQRSGDPDALALPPRQANASLADEGLIALRPLLDGRCHLRLCRGLTHALHVDVLSRHSESDVLGDARV